MNIKLSPKMVARKFKGLLTCVLREQLYFGGSSSGKSYSGFSFTPAMALAGHSILIVRANQNNIKKSVWAEVRKAIKRQGLGKFFEVNKTDKTIISKIGEGGIQFIGCQDAEKIKSITAVNGGAIDRVMIEEATELTEEQYNQLLLRQRGKCKFKKTMVLLFNPIFRKHWIYARFFKPIEEHYDFNGKSTHYESDKLLICKSTYKDNEHLEQEEIDTLEDMQKTSPYHWQVYGLGNFGVLGKLIYDDNWTKVTRKQMLTLLKRKGWEARCGIDNGFNDAQTFSLSFYNEKEKRILVVGEVSMVGVSNVKKYADKVKSILKEFGLSPKKIITADSNDPRMRDLLLGEGLNIRPAIKGAGSKLAGIMNLKRMRMYILDTLQDTIDSITVYSWKKDKAGNYLDETEHHGSDMLDAIRYAYEFDLRKKSTTIRKRK